MLGRLEPSEPALACLWGSPPLWPLPSFYARHGLGSPLPLWPPLTLCCSFLSPFTSLHSPPSCPIPSCLILPQSLLDFHDLYMPVTPKPVFVARSFFLPSSDPVVQLPAGDSNWLSRRSPNAVCSNFITFLYVSCSPSLVSFSKKGTPTSLSAFFCLNSLSGQSLSTQVSTS